MNKIVGATVFLLLNVKAANSQSHFKAHSKGHAYFQWGYNRAAYTNSTIALTGDDYNLVLQKVKARDRPTRPINFKYLAPDQLTIPQNNWRLGYFLKDDLAITFGSDHMKYVVVQNQTINVNGTITRDCIYKGVFANTPTVLTEDFLTFEHTDGLNYVNTEIEKYRYITGSKKQQFILNILFGGGAGIMLPKSNVKLLNYERNDRFHVSGFGISAKAAVECIFFKHLLLKAEIKEGYINMPNIVLHKKGIHGKGSQDFLFTEFYTVLGWNFMLRNPGAKKRRS